MWKRAWCVAAMCLACAFFGAAGCASSLNQGALSEAEAQALDHFPHEVFQGVGQRYVDERGRVDYLALQAARGDLDFYTSALASVGPRTRPKLFPTPEDALAYYLNGYNALVMLNVLYRYPDITSLKEVVTDFFYFTQVQIDGMATDLYNAQHGLIVPFARTHYVGKKEGHKLGRLHMALNRATRSSHELPREAFWPQDVEVQLEREARAFVADARNVKPDAAKKQVVLSDILKQGAGDFLDEEGKPEPVLAWINRYREADAKLDPSWEVVYEPHDWSLNDQALAR